MTNELGTYPQWHKFVFYIKNITSGQIYYPLVSSEEIVDGSGLLEFHPSYQEGEPIPYNPDFIWELEVNIDYSLAAMPPQEILSAEFITNPFQPSEDLVMPLPGNIYAVINKAVYEANDLWIDKPYTQLIISELGYHVNDTLFFGHMNAGEVLRFFLTSPDPPVSGFNMYPIIDKLENVMQEGEIQMWRLNFEDWTDLYFDDVSVDVFIHPDSGAYAGPIAVFSNPEQIAQGDTAEITFKKRHIDGTLEDIPEWRTFEAGLIDGCALGKLSKDGVDTNYIYGVTQPIYFIADSSADSGIVKIRSGLIPEIIAGSMTSSNNKNESTNKKKPAKRYDIIINRTETPALINANYSINTSLESNLQNEFCYNDEFYVNDYSVGDVVVKENNNWCDSLIICNSNEYLPNIILNQVPNGYNGADLCNPSNGLKPQGVTQVYWTDTLYTFDISICSNSQFQKLWFNINDGNYLKVNYTSFICDNLPNDECNLINDWMGFPNTLDCNQLEDIFIAMYKYGGYTIPEVAPCYLLKNVIQAHENEHLKDYQFVIDKEKINLTNSLDSIVINCSVFENINAARNYWMQKIKNEFEEFKIRSKYSYFEFVEDKGGLDLYEDDVQRRIHVKSVIANEIYLVNNFFGCLIQPLFN